MRNLLITVMALVLPMLAVAEDVREVDGISIQGNTELPKNMIIVPWKQQNLSDNVDLPENSLTDEAFDSIDQKTLLRNIEFYNIRK